MHGSADARIRIATEKAGGRVWVVVQDFGGGIEPEHLHRIFDPFFTTKTKPRQGQHKGTGLGLAVSYGIMQEHGGKMHVQSEVGSGTTFRLEFPAPGAARKTAAAPVESEDAAASEAGSAVHA
jgi:signal transduction histidine kinase